MVVVADSYCNNSINTVSLVGINQQGVHIAPNLDPYQEIRSGSKTAYIFCSHFYPYFTTNE